MDSIKPRPEASYSQILRSSTILGGAQGLVYITIVVRAKVIAYLLGTAGIGALGLYQSLVSFASTVSNLGVSASGVRLVASAYQTGDSATVARCVTSLRRVSSLTGFFGWILLAAFALPACRFTFGSVEHAPELVILGSSLVFSSMASGRLSILQGFRRIGSLARAQLLSAVTSAVVSILVYYWMGARGIVPSLILSSVLSFGTAALFSRNLPQSAVRQSWSETAHHARDLISLGVAFMWNAVITGAVSLALRALVVRRLGLDANGIFQATWTLSGMFAGFVLSAMGTDFFPRLAAASTRAPAMNRLVNEQTEIGILLTLPGLLFTLALAPWLMLIFYNHSFVAGADLLPWFVLGIFFQILSWPLGFVQMALGASLAYIVSQTLFNAAHFGLAFLLLHHYGLLGIAYALPGVYLAYTVSILLYCRWRTGFRWSLPVLRLVAASALAIAVAFAAGLFADAIWSAIIRLALGLLVAALTLRGLARRLPREHRLHRLISAFPILRLLVPS